MDSGTPAMHLSLCAITDVGRVRTNNEDAFVAIDLAGSRPFAEIGQLVSMNVGPRGVLLAVSDGMGGAQAGEVASALVLQTLEESLSRADAPTDEALREAVERANHAVFTASKDASRHGMGATLTAVLLRGSTAYIASVGDSRAYLLRGARFRQMTRDQSYVQILMDAGILKPDEVDSSPMKNIVLQSMGQKTDVQVALGRLDLRRGDRLILCSDGLTGHVKDDEIAADISRRDVGLDGIARSLVELALERGGEDNVTVVVAELTGEGLSRAPVPESVTQTFQVLSEFEPNLGVPKTSGLVKSADRASDPASASARSPASTPPAANVGGTGGVTGAGTGAGLAAASASATKLPVAAIAIVAGLLLAAVAAAYFVFTS